jgi:uncharacterized protein YjbI with pentapeptide repeats
MEPQQQPGGRKVLWISGIVAVLVVSILIGYRYHITLWDWIKLLIVPAVIAGGGLWFSNQQREREQRIANERAQDEALQSYLDAMDDALLRHLSLEDASSDHSSFISRELAQARTTTLIARLDAEHNKIVTRFLRNLALTRPPINILWEADLAAAELAGAFLEEANLFKADLRKANLRGTNLSRTNLSGANLFEADLSYANLFGADLSYADLSGADLSQARVALDQLEQAKSLEGATMPNGHKYEERPLQKYKEWLYDRLFKDKEGRGEDGENSGPS